VERGADEDYSAPLAEKQESIRLGVDASGCYDAVSPGKTELAGHQPDRTRESNSSKGTAARESTFKSAWSVPS
jgi:hypothetical protein